MTWRENPVKMNKNCHYPFNLNFKSRAITQELTYQKTVIKVKAVLIVEVNFQVAVVHFSQLSKFFNLECSLHWPSTAYDDHLADLTVNQLFMSVIGYVCFL